MTPEEKREAMEKIIQASFKAGWDSARYWPHKPCPELQIEWDDNNAPKIVGQIWPI